MRYDRDLLESISHRVDLFAYASQTMDFRAITGLHDALCTWIKRHPSPSTGIITISIVSPATRAAPSLTGYSDTSICHFLMLLKKLPNWQMLT